MFIHFVAENGKKSIFFCAINVMITITKGKPINFFNPKKKKNPQLELYTNT